MTKKEVRGSIRWFRKENLVFLKWRDTKDVCALSTCYAASGEDRTQRKTKVNGQFQTLNIPMLKNYNAGMGGVDLSGQLLQEEQESGGKHCFFILWIFLQQIHILYTRKILKV